MKASPGSGRVWNFIMGVLERPRQAPSPIAQSSKKFLQSSRGPILSGVSSGQRLQQNSAGHCYDSTPQFASCSCSSVKFPNAYRLLTILRTLPVTASESERVFSTLQRTLTSIRCTMTEDRPEALLLLQCLHEHCPMPDSVLRKPDDSTSFRG